MDCLHVHHWNPFWTNNLRIFLLSDNNRKTLLEAYQKSDIKLLQAGEFLSLWNGIDKAIEEIGPVFFKLSSISPKDSYYKSSNGEPVLKSSNTEKLFNVFLTSMRIGEEIEDEGDFAIILAPWNDKIKFDNEYRCFVFYGVCEAIAKMCDESDPNARLTLLINNYINKHLHLFPSKTVALDIIVTEQDEIIFVEFNPIDDEIDNFGILRRDKLLSTRAMLALVEPPKK